MTAFLYGSLYFFVFTIPWEDISVIPKIGTVSRLMGMILMCVYILEFKQRKTITRPNLVLILMFLFVLWNGFSIIWSINMNLTYTRLVTDIQLLSMVWIIFDLVKSDMEQNNLMQAYVLGAYISVISTLQNYVFGQIVAYNRYAASGFDPNDLGVIMALGIPLAVYLTSHYKKFKIFRVLNFFYIIIGPIAILLTASRTAAVVTIVALIYIIFGAKMKKSSRFVFLFVGALLAIKIIPQSVYLRLATITSEVTTGTLNDRTMLWKSGLSYFVGHPLLGVGAGSYRYAMLKLLGHSAVAHNSYISVLVETGIIGVILFYSVIFILLLNMRLHLEKQRMCFFLLIMILIGIFMLSWEYRKPTWFILGLVLTNLYRNTMGGKGNVNLADQFASNWRRS